ncbi:MAG: translation initiation factor [Fimbriimonadaceae bacterium]|jgi:translation initiation factor IF-2|nr:translation initiation factor [Fimbriimonadaceae bacterium]
MNIADLAKEFELVPGHVYAALTDLGIDHDGLTFDADDDSVELVRQALTEHIGSKEIGLKPNPTPREVALALGVSQPDVQKTLMTKMRVMATLTTTLKADVAEKLVELYGYTIRWADAPKARAVAAAGGAKKAGGGAQTRPPVVTIMGHVDHGKTSLLDYIRKANVAGKEHGGITQHIGAYQVELPEGKITFLDTPGHAAFTQMRARGAQVTDLAILVVAADDGIMPQTIEAISHIKNANVPMIVAVNKIDRPNANPDRVMRQLPEHEVIPESYGGDVVTAPVSAITGEGVPHLLEMIILQSGIMNLTADPKGKVEGTVVEAKLEKGRGPVATVLVQSGTLKVGDAIVVGQTYGRIRSMTDYLGQKLTEAGPSTPVEILGLENVPAAGDKIEATVDERTAREIASGRADTARLKSLEAPSRGMTLSQLRQKLNTEELKELNLIIKADVQGSVEAVRGMLEKVRNEEVETRIIHSGVGSITEGDILLASTSNAIVVGFNTKPEPGAKREAERHKVEIRTYNIIYELIEDIEAAVKGMLEPKFEEQYLGTVDVRIRFQFSKKGVIAGCYVSDGRVVRNAGCRVMRAKELVYEGKIASLKHLKDDVREVTMGMECGITFDNWEQFKEGDVVQAFEMVQVNA